MEGHDVDLGQGRESNRVASASAAVFADLIARVAEEPFVADADQVLGVDALDEAGNVVGPVGDRVGRAVPRAGVGAGADAAGLVGELPHHDGGVVLVFDTRDRVGAVEQVADVVLVPLPDAPVGVEVVVVVEPCPLDVLVHAAEVGPVVGEGDDQAQALLARLGDDVVELLQAAGAVVVRRPPRLGVPVLDVGVVLGVPDRVGVTRHADVEPAPRADDVESVRRGLLQHRVGHHPRLVVQVVVVGAGEAERAAADLEVVALALHEAGGGRRGRGRAGRLRGRGTARTAAGHSECAGGHRCHGCQPAGRNNMHFLQARWPRSTPTARASGAETSRTARLARRIGSM